MADKKRLFSGIQPSGVLHIGNYFGALKQWLTMQEEYECVFSVVDYHALTSVKDPTLLRENILNTFRDLLAIGIDPNKSILFQQSRVSEHTELAWILETLVPVSLLELGHAYKDKVAKGLDANVGLFTYPMLMAADILLYDTDVVPVGEDQRQHVEYAREAANKFNNTFSETFIEPKELINKDVAVVPGTDGKKMSKSYGNTIPLFGTKDEITKAVMSIVTDSEGNFPVNVRNIHSILHNQMNNLPAGKTSEEFDNLYINNTKNYKALKEALIEDLETFIAPMREKRNNSSDEEILKVIEEGSAKAKKYASKKMEEVRQKVGVSF